MPHFKWLPKSHPFSKYIYLNKSTVSPDCKRDETEREQHPSPNNHNAVKTWKWPLSPVMLPSSLLWFPRSVRRGSVCWASSMSGCTAVKTPGKGETVGGPPALLPASLTPNIRFHACYSWYGLMSSKLGTGGQGPWEARHAYMLHNELYVDPL